MREEQNTKLGVLTKVFDKKKRGKLQVQVLFYYSNNNNQCT